MGKGRYVQYFDIYRKTLGSFGIDRVSNLTKMEQQKNGGKQRWGKQNKTTTSIDY